MLTDPDLPKASIAIAVFALLFIAERIAPAVRGKSSSRRLLTNGSLALIVLVLSPLISVPLAALASSHAFWVRPEAIWSGVWLIGDLIVLDIFTYWLHRAYHHVGPMWQLHAAHHYDETLDTTSALRFHIGEVALSAALRMLPIALLAIPLGHVVLFEIVLFCGAVFHHSNLKMPQWFERPLSAMIITPRIHWVHHHATHADTNSNFGAVLSCWDHLFSSASQTRRTDEMKIGIENQREKSLLGLLTLPFSRRVENDA